MGPWFSAGGLCFMFSYTVLENLKFNVFSWLIFYKCTIGKSLVLHIPDICLLSWANFAPQIRFKTTVAILAVEQRLLSYNTCRRFSILRSEIASWLLNLPAPSELVGRIARDCSYLLQIFQLEGYFYLPRNKI